MLCSAISAVVYGMLGLLCRNTSAPVGATVTTTGLLFQALGRRNAAGAPAGVAMEASLWNDRRAGQAGQRRDDQLAQCGQVVAALLDDDRRGQLSQARRRLPVPVGAHLERALRIRCGGVQAERDDEGLSAVGPHVIAEHVHGAQPSRVA